MVFVVWLWAEWIRLLEIWKSRNWRIKRLFEIWERRNRGIWCLLEIRKWVTWPFWWLFVVRSWVSSVLFELWYRALWVKSLLYNWTHGVQRLLEIRNWAHWINWLLKISQRLSWLLVKSIKSGLLVNDGHVNIPCRLLCIRISPTIYFMILLFNNQLLLQLLFVLFQCIKSVLHIRNLFFLFAHFMLLHYNILVNCVDCFINFFKKRHFLCLFYNFWLDDIL